MRKLLLVVTFGLGMSLTAFAGLRYNEQAYWDQRWQDMAFEFQEQQYEAQIQAQLDAMAQRQLYIESLLNQCDEE